MQKFNFHGKGLDKFGTFFHIIFFNKAILLPVNVCKIAE